MIVGRNREFVHLQRPRDRRTPDGDIVHEYETVEQVWLELRPLAGREYWQAQQAQSTATHRGSIRYRSDVTPDWRLKLVESRRVLNIVSAVQAGARGEDLALVLTEVAT